MVRVVAKCVRVPGDAAQRTPCRELGQHTMGPLPMDHADPGCMRADYDNWPQDEFHGDGLAKVAAA